MTSSFSIYTLCTDTCAINLKKHRHTWAISQVSEYMNVIQAHEKKAATTLIILNKIGLQL